MEYVHVHTRRERVVKCPLDSVCLLCFLSHRTATIRAEWNLQPGFNGFERSKARAATRSSASHEPSTTLLLLFWSGDACAPSVPSFSTSQQWAGARLSPHHPVRVNKPLTHEPRRIDSTLYLSPLPRSVFLSLVYLLLVTLSLFLSTDIRCSVRRESEHASPPRSGNAFRICKKRRDEYTTWDLLLCVSCAQNVCL